MKPGKVASNSLFGLSGEIFSRIMRFALVIAAARMLGDADYGKITFAIAFGALFLILADFGLHELLVREIAKKPQDVERLLGNGLLIKLGLSTVTAISIYLAGKLSHKPHDVLMTVYVIGAAQITGSLAEYFSTVFQGLQKLKHDAIANVILSFSNTVIGIIVLVAGGGFLELAWVYLVARLLKLIYCLALAATKFVRIRILVNTSLLRFLLFEGAVFGITRFFAVMYTNVDSTMLSFMVGDKEVGWYNAAYRLIFAMMVIPIGIMRAVYPALSAYFKSDPAAFQKLFAKTTKILFWTGTSIASAVFVLADKIILFVYGRAYVNAAIALRLLVWSTAFYFVGVVMTNVTRSAGQQRFTAKVVTASAFLNLILNFILIPRYSYVGAAFATLMSEFFTFSFHFGFVGKNIVKSPLLSLLPKVTIINTVMTISLWFLNDYPLFVLLVTAVTVNFLMVFALKYFNKEEILAFRRMGAFLPGRTS